MGHKVNPKIFRIGITTNWNSKWFASGRDYTEKAQQDITIRRYIMKKMHDGGVVNVEIERSHDKIGIVIHSAKPGIIIGRGGASVEETRQYILKKIIKDKSVKINIDIKEVSKPQLSAMIVTQNIVADIEKRIPFRRSMKRSIESVLKAGALGVKIVCSGRLDGAEIARREMLYQGKIPLHTLRADIDYARLAAHTTYGAVGIKVWIYKGDIFTRKKEKVKDNEPVN
ncbi:MAG TPA: 30S ribosomal protein S3 [bacterium]|nr:30S ribosomal protein S3 [bacterium]